MSNPSEHSENFAKIKFVEGDDVETLWAVELGNNLFRLDNSPFYAYRVSWEDIIEASEVEEGFYDFVRIVEKSGNRTLRIIFLKFTGNDTRGKEILNEIKNLGCSYEGMNAKLISINIPPAVEFETAVNYVAEQIDIDWEYADPSYDELFPENDEEASQQDS
jgi:hypothetical protein